MQGNKRRDTKPEMVVRKMLRDLGFPGYRLDWKKAHGHPDIEYASTPKTHADYWEAKFARNVERDAEVRAAMEADGWQVVEIWECELKKDRIDETRERLRSEIEYAFIKM